MIIGGGLNRPTPISKGNAMKIKFLKDVEINVPKRSFAKGEVIELSDDACRHFITRRCAEIFNGQTPKPVEAEESAPVEDVEAEVEAEVSAPKKGRKGRK